MTRVFTLATTLFRADTDRPRLQRVAFNTGWLFADRIARMAMNIVIGAWVARYLGPDRFGTFNWAIALIGLISPISGLGLDSLIVRDLVRDAALPLEQSDITLGTTVVLKLIGTMALVTASLCAVYSVLPHDATVHALVAILACGSLWGTTDAIDFFFQSILQAKYTVYARNIAFLITAGLRVWLILSKASVVAFAWAIFFESFCGAVGLCIFYERSGRHLRNLTFRKSRAKQLLLESWPLMLSGVVIMIYMRIDQLMLGQMLGQHYVGIYSAAVRVSELWYFVPMAICSSVAPAIMATRQVNQPLYYRRLQQLFTLLVLMSYTVAIPVTIFATPLMRLIYGENYISGAAALTVHVWAGVFVALGVSRQIWLIAEGHMRFALFSTGMGAVVNVLLNLVLIPRYGPVGTAAATLVAQIVAVCITTVCFRPAIKIFPMQLRALVLNGGRLL